MLTRFLTCAICLACFDNAAIVAEIRLLPAGLTLDGQGTRHRMMVETYDGDMAVGPSGALYGESIAKLHSSDESVVRIEGNQLVSVSNGQVTIDGMLGQVVFASETVTVTNAAVGPVPTGRCRGVLSGRNRTYARRILGAILFVFFVVEEFVPGMCLRARSPSCDHHVGCM